MKKLTVPQAYPQSSCLHYSNNGISLLQLLSLCDSLQKGDFPWSRLVEGLLCLGDLSYWHF